MIAEHRVSYATFKSAVQSSGACVCWKADGSGTYTLFAATERFFLTCDISNPTQVADFEATFKTTGCEVTSMADALVVSTIGSSIALTVPGGLASENTLDAVLAAIKATHTRLRPDQTFIERWAAKAIVAGADQLFTNTDPVPTGYTPQQIDYTVPAGKVFYLKGLRVALDSPGNSTNVMLAIEIGPNKKLRMSLNTNSPSQGTGFDPAIPIPEGTAVRVWAHGSSGSTVTFVRFSGVEENA